MIPLVVYLAASAGIAAWMLPTGRERPPAAFPAPRAKALWPLPTNDPEQARAEALRKARVWRAINAADAKLGANPADPDGALSEPVVRCHYLDGPARGTTAKFDCVLRNGEVIKVKYGHTGEIQAEIAASRLLTALGFGADRMFLVEHLRCYGCLRTPFYTAWLLDRLRARGLVTRSIPEDSYSDFEWAAVERHFDGVAIEAGVREGWAWFELDAVDPSLGANRAERDALRLAAVMLAHWDNKASNQRLVCLAPMPSSPANCPRPFALINDLGATFGPNKVDLNHWMAAPIWADRARCTVSMQRLPYGGGTFPDATISEAGRQLIAGQLAALTERQVTDLFTGARFSEFAGGHDASAAGWTRAFMDKVRQISDGEPCPH